MFNNGTNNSIAKALMAGGKASKPDFAGKVKGSNLGNIVPSVDPALKALAYNKRKKIKLG